MGSYAYIVKLLPKSKNEVIIMGLLKALFGDYSKKEIKRIKPKVNRVLELEDTYKEMSEDELKGQTQILKDRLAKGETLDEKYHDH